MKSYSNIVYSEFLFARPSYIEGVSRALDIGSTLNSYNSSETSHEADMRALRADWMTIGADLRQAIYSVVGMPIDIQVDDEKEAQ